jgi:integrase
MMAMILVMFDTRIRVGELVGIKWRKWIWNAAFSKFLAKARKNVSFRLAPLRTFRPEPARPDIDNILLSVDGYPLSVNAIVHMMYRLGFSYHSPDQVIGDGKEEHRKIRVLTLSATLNIIYH